MTKNATYLKLALLCSIILSLPMTDPHTKCIKLALLSSVILIEIALQILIIKSKKQDSNGEQQ